MSAGTRSSAMTAHAPASSAMRACSALTTSPISPPLLISGKVRLTCIVPVCFCMFNYLLHDRIYNVCTKILSHREREPLQPIEPAWTSHMVHYSPGTHAGNSCRRTKWISVSYIIWVLPCCQPGAEQADESGDHSPDKEKDHYDNDAAHDDPDIGRATTSN